MFRETSRLFSQVGEEPSGYALLAFGGAGPMLGCLLAETMGMDAVIIPQTPGVLAALGGLLADLRSDFVRVVFLDVGPGSPGALREALHDLAGEARSWLFDGQGYEGEASLSVSADMRYRGQSYEIETPLDAAAVESGDTAAILAAFHAEHERIFGHADPRAVVQLVNLRLVISGSTPKPAVRRIARATSPASPLKVVAAWFDGTEHQTPVYARAGLYAGQRIAAPAILGQDDTTTVVPPGFVIEVDDYGNLVIASTTAEN
jgi:N-methylhydantoinase A